MVIGFFPLVFKRKMPLADFRLQSLPTAAAAPGQTAQTSPGSAKPHALFLCGEDPLAPWIPPTPVFLISRPRELEENVFSALQEHSEQRRWPKCLATVPGGVLNPAERAWAPQAARACGGGEEGEGHRRQEEAPKPQMRRKTVEETASPVCGGEAGILRVEGDQAF